jgi:hypothetical protein
MVFIKAAVLETLSVIGIYRYPQKGRTPLQADGVSNPKIL